MGPEESQSSIEQIKSSLLYWVLETNRPGFVLKTEPNKLVSCMQDVREEVPGVRLRNYLEGTIPRRKEANVSCRFHKTIVNNLYP